MRLPEDIVERAATWRLVKVDSSRWKITDAEGERWAPMPRVVEHPQLGGDHGYDAMMAPRKIAQEALECYRRGEVPPTYRQTAEGLVLMEEDDE